VTGLIERVNCIEIDNESVRLITTMESQQRNHNSGMLVDLWKEKVVRVCVRARVRVRVYVRVYVCTYACVRACVCMCVCVRVCVCVCMCACACSPAVTIACARDSTETSGLEPTRNDTVTVLFA
jgi:hypothetical protein